MKRINLVGRALGATTLLSLFGIAIACQGIADIPDVKYYPYCAEYCNKLALNCPGELAVYETPRECMEACAILDENANFSRVKTAGNTMGCRME